MSVGSYAPPVMFGLLREARIAVRSFTWLPFAPPCAPMETAGPGEYTGLAGSLYPGEAGNIVCRLLRPSTDSTIPDSDAGITGSWLFA